MDDSNPIVAVFFPTAEQEAAKDLAGNMHSLSDFVRELKAALLLCEHAEYLLDKSSEHNHRELMRDWKRMAMRDGAMSIYHFGKVWGVMPTLVRRCPTLMEHMDRELFNRVGGMFEQGFPQWAAVRKSVAHRGDLSKARNRTDENAADVRYESDAVSMNMTNSYVGSAVIGRTYISTVEGKSAQYDLTPDTLQRLETIYTTIVRAFAAASPIIEKQWRASRGLGG